LSSRRRAQRKRRESEHLPKVGDDNCAEITDTVFDARYRFDAGRTHAFNEAFAQRLDTKWQSEHRLADPKGGDEPARRIGMTAIHFG